ncbi:hypothetical protein, unlikely [Trypanosoma brucei gambiense DAL972]|uniref:Uncharacterized protein n=1 Tax=Trypanosoma brucei gambiense (strain MHOM/CI/86/DAL972) TaxID=679716 RepID=C9ZU13_TRYB9|nr:hypothetical protein, unlikely [Trypanosoma brucei gambiense DAL972]CBH12899.1 hypothetical protein, unlikely [Trypanosoma brucei gambiense DAL972]|eukprot:XP_011775178.1 hypothetical protein, unlikely [Trypanosoma brucei gambiense DAL972]
MTLVLKCRAKKRARWGSKKKKKLRLHFATSSASHCPFFKKIFLEEKSVKGGERINGRGRCIFVRRASHTHTHVNLAHKWEKNFKWMTDMCATFGSKIITSK